MTVELVYDHNCPNVAEARNNLMRALALAHLPATWTEWDLSTPDAPAHVRGFGSPAVLVNAREVTGSEPSDALACCRLYQGSDHRYHGAPQPDLILSALKRESAPAWKRSLFALPGIGVALLPKLACPACWPAYAGLLSSLGLGFLLSSTYLVPLTLVSLALAVGALGFHARRRHGYGPLFLGLTASVVVAVGKLGYESNAVTYAGLAVLVVASLWNTRPPSVATALPCPACLLVSSGSINQDS